jgi:iron complex outermembrane receptor protein
MLSPRVSVPFVVMLGSVGAPSPSVWAAVTEKRAFNLPGGDAAVTLRQFAAVSGKPIVYLTDRVRGARTNEVTGEYESREALDRMLEGTGLQALHDPATGALVVSRKRLAEDSPPTSEPETTLATEPKPKPMNSKNPIAIFSAWLALALPPMQAQQAPAGTKPPEDDRVLLSSFEVSSTKDRGYTSSNSATGFKTNETLLRIPQAVTVVTRDLIDDMGYADSSNILQFAGVSNFYAGEAMAMRGTRINNPYLDEMRDGTPYLDNVNIDSYTVLRGPAATLYLGASLGGTVLKTSKRPLNKAQHVLTARVNQNGAYRSEVDFTGPVAKIGDIAVAYRLVAAQQGGDQYFKNMSDDRTVVHPTLQLSTKNTVVRVAFDYQHLLHIPNANNFITPTGKLYTGAGRDEAYFVKGTMEDFYRRGVRFIAIQKLAENWDVKVAATRWWFSRLGSVVFPAGGVNWPNQTVTFTARRNDEKADFSVALLDINGKYQLGKIGMSTALGASYSDEIGKSRFWSSAAFGSKTVPIASPRLDLLTAPLTRDYIAPANPGSQGTTYRGDAYIQQSIELLPNRLTAVVGLTQSKIKSNRIANLATRPPATVTQGDELLYRFGVVLNLTKDMVVYGMESTNFSPSGNRDVNLNLLPSIEGKGREAGIKTAFLDGRISSTLSFFNLALTNQSFFAGVRPDGISYFAPIGSTTQKGFDFDLALSPVPGLQFVATYYNGKVRDQAGKKVANSYSGDLSLVGRYEFQGGSLKGLMLGAGFSRISGRLVSLGAYNTGVVGQSPLIEMEPGNLLNLFGTYRINSHWTLRGNIDNLLDEAYALGAQNAYFVDPSPPRTVSLSVIYRF